MHGRYIPIKYSKRLYRRIVGNKNFKKLPTKSSADINIRLHKPLKIFNLDKPYRDTSV